MEKLTGRNLKLFGEETETLFRKVFLLVLEGVEDGDNLLRVSAITLDDAFESGSVHLTPG
jgi:hypothetical protein